MPQLCLMCESEFSETVEYHRYSKCPYYNGCGKCGLEQASAVHVRECEGRATICILCFVSYSGELIDHRSDDCQYYKGCRRCGKPRMSQDHFASCGKSPIVLTTYRLCGYCRGDIEESKFYAHEIDCWRKRGTGHWRKTYPGDGINWLCSYCGKTVHFAEYDRHVERCRHRAQELRCSLCGVPVPSGEYGDHIRLCREKRSSIGRADEIRVTDHRPAKSRRIVIFPGDERGDGM